jgi:hypothetical protein
MCADMQYEVLLIFVTLLTRVITKMPIYTNRVQMHFQDTLKYKRFLTQITRKSPLSSMSVQMYSQGTMRSERFLTNITLKWSLSSMTVRGIFKVLCCVKDFLHTSYEHGLYQYDYTCELSSSADVSNISYTHQKKKTDFHYKCIDEFSSMKDFLHTLHEKGLSPV